ncbi:uncharacterized protein LOC105211940 [Zeugodacus cucurbitae]|uniref:uncharacterized protein LOC105211940 n=1 Tax=Zeugodacus cucurbitae TaxID=28588 RepID=UPI0005969668|nr:uncharacterized protein LOC105211940 [Zeugodacus cucurbitae]
MKHQQVVVDYWNMIKTSFTCLLLAFSGYILIKMVQTIFWLPGYLQKNQKRLEELAAQYNLELDGDKSLTDVLKAQIEATLEEKQTLTNEESVEDKSNNALVVTANVEGEPKKQK